MRIEGLRIEDVGLRDCPPKKKDTIGCNVSCPKVTYVGVTAAIEWQ